MVSSSPNEMVYCPKLLFSRDKIKISAALEDLFLNPSNQLRLFSKSFVLNTLEMK